MFNYIIKRGRGGVKKRIYIYIPGVPKKTIPKIKVFYEKSRSGIISKPYSVNTLGGLDMIL